MALSRRSGQRFQASIWPGFVDAMTALLLMLMFVLTIFMVVQYVLRERITGQESQLDELQSQILSLADALGLEQQRAFGLEQNIERLDGELAGTKATVDAQFGVIATLAARNDAQTQELAANAAALSSFEEQVASLIAQRDTALDTGVSLSAELADVEAARATLISEKDALQLALVTARSEIDAEVEAARLAAAKGEALQALITDLRRQATERDETLADTLARLEGETTRGVDLSARVADLEGNLTEAEAQRLQNLAAAEALRARLDGVEAALTDEETTRLTEAAAAVALREKLKNADDELTAMTLALEEQRRSAEETLTLLAAADAANGDLDGKLAAALLASSVTNEDVQETQAALDAAVAELKSLGNIEGQNADLEAQLALVLAAKIAGERTTAQSQRSLADAMAQIENLAGVEGDRETIRGQLAAALAAQLVAESAARNQLSAAEERAVLLATAQGELATVEAQNADAQRSLALLNAQVATLRTQLGSLQNLLDDSAVQDAQDDVQIQALGSQLNTALARLAAEEKRRRVLEQAERERLEAQAQDLERYRSEFFGQLRDVLGAQDGVQIVGDRFVFSSEVLFRSAEVDLSFEGRAQISKIAGILKGITGQIPDEIDWVIRVDGHTDNIPLSGRGRYRDNWELSQARALSVVRYMAEELGIPPGRLAANGFGEFQPINTDDTPEARSQNRRIELKFTEK